VPEKGKANRAIAELLAKTLGLKKSQITLLSGETDSHKKFLLTGVTEEEIRRKIEAEINNWPPLKTPSFPQNNQTKKTNRLPGA